MSNYANAKAYIDTQVYSNHANQVTAPMVNNAIKKVIDTIIAGGYLYKGIAHPGDAAVTSDANIFYIATEAGTYTNKGGLVVADGEVAVLKYNGSWSKEVTGAATAAQVSALGHKIDEIAQGKFYGYFEDASELPAGDVPGFAYVGTAAPFSIYNFDGSDWSDSGLTINEIPIGNGEDIDTDAQGKLQFADRPNTDGMGYIILRKNKTFAEQVTAANTTYEIRYDFDLNGADVVIPSGCYLHFVGGKLLNGTISGKILNDCVRPEWFGAKGDGIADDTLAIQKAIDFAGQTPVEFGAKTYVITETIRVHTHTYLRGVFQNSTTKAITSKSDFKGTILDFQLASPKSWAIDTDVRNSVGDYFGPVDWAVSQNYNSSCYGVTISGMFIYAQTSLGVYGGIRLNYAPNSLIENVVISNFDIALSVITSWATKVRNVYGSARHIGVLIGNETNDNYFENTYIVCSGDAVVYADLPSFISNSVISTYTRDVYNDLTNDFCGQTFGYLICENTTALTLINTDTEFWEIGRAYINAKGVTDIGAYSELNKVDFITIVAAVDIIGSYTVANAVDNYLMWPGNNSFVNFSSTRLASARKIHFAPTTYVDMLSRNIHIHFNNVFGRLSEGAEFVENTLVDEDVIVARPYGHAYTTGAYRGIMTLAEALVAAENSQYGRVVIYLFGGADDAFGSSDPKTYTNSKELVFKGYSGTTLNWNPLSTGEGRYIENRGKLVFDGCKINFSATPAQSTIKGFILPIGFSSVKVNNSTITFTDGMNFISEQANANGGELELSILSSTINSDAATPGSSTRLVHSVAPRYMPVRLEIRSLTSNIAESNLFNNYQDFISLVFNGYDYKKIGSAASMPTPYAWMDGNIAYVVDVKRFFYIKNGAWVQSFEPERKQLSSIASLDLLTDGNYYGYIYDANPPAGMTSANEFESRVYLISGGNNFVVQRVYSRIDYAPNTDYYLFERFYNPTDGWSAWKKIQFSAL